MKKLFLSVLTVLVFAHANAGGYKVVRTFHCPEANQGVAVDDSHFYAIDNQCITKYDMDGRAVASWSEKDPRLIKHFDGGIVIDGLLYCSHSNFPEVPMASSIEIFDTRTMVHVKTVSFGIEYGSCTWVVRGDGCWYACFAHYDTSGGNAGGELLHDASWSQIVQFDDQWRKTQAWALPKEVLAAVKPHSLSGGLFVDGKFYCTGHDAKKIFVLEFPPYGMRMVLSETIDIPFRGQGIAMDSKGNIWGIERKTKEVVKTSLSNE